MPVATSWNSLVVLVESSVNAWGKPSNLALQLKNLLVLSLQAHSVNRNVYHLVTREDLEAKAGKDPKAIATALVQLIKQDRIKGLARKEKERPANDDEDMYDSDDEDNHDEDDEDQSITVESDAESQLQGERAPRISTARQKANMRNKEINNELLHGIDKLSSYPTEEDLSIAREILSITDREAKADRIFVLEGFPANAAEAELLVTGGLGERALDAVIELVGGGPFEDKDSSVDLQSRRQSRSDSRVSEGQVSSASASAGTSAGETLELSHVPSAQTLPAPKLSEVLHVGTSSLSASHSLPSILANRVEMDRSKGLALALGAQFPENDIVASLKQAATQARGPGWKDVVFLEVPVVPRSKSDDLSKYTPFSILQTFTGLAMCTAKEKYRFKRFLEKCGHVHIPVSSRTSDDKMVFEAYEQAVQKTTSRESMASIPVILDAMVQAITGEPPGEENVAPVSELEKSIVLVPLGDDTMIRLAQAKLAGFEVDNASRIDLSADRKLWIPGGKGRAGMPLQPRISTLERGIRTSQFECFQDLDAERFEYLTVVEAFERLMQRIDPAAGPSWNLTDRICQRTLTGRLATQIISKARRSEPHVYTQYLDQEDLLLVVLYKQTPVGRQREIIRSAFEHTNLRPTFTDWPKQDLRVRPCYFDVDPETINKLEQRVHMLFPSDQGIIRLESVPSGQAWCSVEKDGHLFGLRNSEKHPQAGSKPLSASKSRSKERVGSIPGNGNGAPAAVFYASFDDQTWLELDRGEKIEGKPDGYATMVSRYTSSSGLRVCHRTDGTILMTNRDARPNEEERAIVGPGVVVRFLQDDRRETLFPNGDVVTESLKGDAENKVVTSFGALLEGRSSELRLTQDPTSGAIVLTRKMDNTVLTVHKNGDMVAQHCDGTCIMTLKGGSLVRIEAKGFGTTKCWTEIERTAEKHSRGGRVDISRGGNNTRSSTLLPDATVVHIDYNTRVTAKVNGSLRIHKSDGTTVEASDDGVVVWRPWNVQAEQANRRAAITAQEEEKKLHLDAREEPDRLLGCYSFNCDEASLRIRDWESNIFHVSSATNIQRRKVDVSLSGEFDPVPAVINSPLAPQLFVMRGDGTGYELLTEAQVHYQRHKVEGRFRNQFENASFEGVDALVYEHDQAKAKEAQTFAAMSKSRQRTLAITEAAGGSLASLLSSSQKNRAPNVEDCIREQKLANNASETETVQLRLDLPLEQLSIQDKLRTVLEWESSAVDAFSALGTSLGSASAARRKHQRLKSKGKGSDYILYDSVIKLHPLSLKERDALVAAKQAYAEFKMSLAAKEDAYNVDDPRCEEAVEESRKIQKIIMRERRKYAKAQLKIQRKINASKIAQTQPGLSSRSRFPSHRSHRSHRSRKSTTTPTRKSTTQSQNTGLGTAVEGELGVKVSDPIAECDEDWHGACLVGDSLAGSEDEFGICIDDSDYDDEDGKTEPFEVPSPRNSPLGHGALFWQALEESKI